MSEPIRENLGFDRFKTGFYDDNLKLSKKRTMLTL